MSVDGEATTPGETKCKFCGIESNALPWPTCSSMEEFRQCFGDPGLSLGRDHPVAQAISANQVGVMPSDALGGEVQPTKTPG